MEKIYLNNSYVREFSADIVNVVNKDGKTALVLNKTAFYPEGGGQPSDTGYIGGSRVTYVYEEDGTVYHVVEREPKDLSNVMCSIDWNRRFDHMQQHCGQHILSAAFDKLLKGATAGFHLGNEYVTVDISIESLSPDDAIKVEAMANDVIFANLPVKYHYPEPDELYKFPLRKAPSVEENIRIVEIEDFDFSPCGGTHPKLTGDIGLIKIRKWEKYKNYVRVEFVCGNRALNDYRWKNDYINQISNILSSKDTDVLENVKKTISELHAANKNIKAMKDELLSYEASELYDRCDAINGVKIVKHVFTDREFKEVIALASKISKKTSAIAFLGLKSESAQIVFTRSTDIDIKINELFKEILPLISGKGGGNPQSAQGGGPDVSNLESAIESAYIILKNRYLKK